MDQKPLSIKIDHVSKKYKLGAIGGTTLREELQRKMAIRRHKEDPTLKIGVDASKFGEEFLALDDVSFEVKKGEAVGIIGHNGAGKSTLLKLITRVTGPTSGKIGLNGRITSMLEVGTGFHGELTGRENIYMNGAILGMTKKEIDERIEDIIDFSEVRQFIDTPVKRYSSGMYVKLAFSVAAHLNSEIMIMDEVLAVGDMAFQKKCISRMKNASMTEGRTVLYVSHNMNTIRQLCNRCIVLDHGKLVFDGDVETAIALYLNIKDEETGSFVDLENRDRPGNSTNRVKMHAITFENSNDCVYKRGVPIHLKFDWTSLYDLEDVRCRMILRFHNDDAVGLTQSDSLGDFKKDQSSSHTFSFDTSMLAEGKYFFSVAFFQNDGIGGSVILDHVTRACSFEIVSENEDKLVNWEHEYWGSVRLPDLEVLSDGG